MLTTKAAILSQLQREIFPLQGLKHNPAATAVKVGLGTIEAAFPNAVFPIGAIHEFLTEEACDAAATGGFIAGLLAKLMQQDGASVWISASRMIFPPALKYFGVEPGRMIFVDVKNEKEVLWALEEALKCNGLKVVIAELKEITFTASRRLQLAVEQSRVTGFILRHGPGNTSTTACLARWKITSMASVVEDGLPGVGFPRWNVTLLKIRNGIPGTWQLEFSRGHFRPCTQLTSIPKQFTRKTG